MIKKIKQKLDQDRDEILIIIAACLSWGILAHGFMIFHKLSYHDDQVALFNVGTTIANGRWMLEALSWFSGVVWGGGIQYTGFFRPGNFLFDCSGSLCLDSYI